VGAALVAQASRQAAFAGKPGELGYGRFVKAMGWLQAPFALLFLGVLVLKNPPGETIPLLIAFGFFGFSATYMFLAAYVSKGSYDAEGITLRSPFGVRNQQRWADFERARFHRGFGDYALTFRDGTTIHLSTLLRGHGAALEQLEHSRLIKVEGAPRRP